jgi:hypothetical protein
MHYTGQLSDAILWVFFLLTSHKLRMARPLVRELKKLETSLS